MDTTTESQKPDSSSAATRALKLLAILSLLAGVGIGLYSLAAVLGVWFGMWGFRTGAGMLRTVNDSAVWVIGFSLVVAIVVFFMARRLNMKNAARLTTFAVTGAMVATIAFVVPLTYSPAEGTPAIHDITTNTDNPPQFIAIAPLRADAPNNMVYGEQENWDKQSMAAAQHKAYPDIVPQEFTEPKAEVFNRALAAANELGWEVVAQDPATGRIEATDTTFWFRFKDDIVIEVTETAQGSVLNARSLSRVGTSDVGKNADRLREFFNQLD